MHLFMCLLLSLLVTELCHFHRGKKTFFIRSGKVMSVIKAVKSTWKSASKCLKHQKIHWYTKRIYWYIKQLDWYTKKIHRYTKQIHWYTKQIDWYTRTTKSLKVKEYVYIRPGVTLIKFSFRQFYRLGLSYTGGMKLKSAWISG